MAEHRRPGDVAAVLEYRHQYDPVRQVRDGRIAHVRVVRQDDVAFLDLAVIRLHERADERAELADDHLALRVGDHREAVALLADTRRHRGPEQHRVHFDPGVLQGVLDDVRRDALDLDLLQRSVVGFDDSGWHGSAPLVT